MCKPRQRKVLFTMLRGSVLVFLIVCLAAPRPAEAQGLGEFGDIVVRVRSEPKGQAAHGYAEYVFTVTNRSTDRAHGVALVIPRDESSRSDDHIRSISRTVQVEPRTTLQVALLHPDYPLVEGGGLKVIVDGREQEGGVALAVVSGRRGMHAPPYYGRRSRHYPTSRIKGETGTEPLILVSQRVGEKFKLESQLILGRGEPAKGGLPPAPPGVEPIDDPEPLVRKGLGSGKVWVRGQPVRSEEPVSSWSPRWLGYSRYDGIVLTRDELEGLGRGPAESQAIQTALRQYVEAGGSMLVLDAGALTLPASWKLRQERRNDVRVSHGGFGVCLQIDNRDSSSWSDSTWNEVAGSWLQTAAPYQTERSLMDANASLPIVDDMGLPVRSLFLLLLLFAVGIGPCNLWLLSRWKRRIWLLWTVPVISLCTCAAVFGCMIFAEGLQGRTRVAAFTLLDETEQRATTLGRSAIYSPLTPSDGLRFSQDTEVTVQGIGASGAVAICDLDWTRDQHLRRGWMSARVPAHLQLRRSEVKRLERLPVSRAEDGSLQVTNQLGASIKRLWLADETGRIHTAGVVNVGQVASLTPTGKTSGKIEGAPYRWLYTTSDWAGLGKLWANRDLPKFLEPRTYLAVLESSPFLEPGLSGAVVRPTESYVLGLMAE